MLSVLRMFQSKVFATASRPKVVQEQEDQSAKRIFELECVNRELHREIDEYRAAREDDRKNLLRLQTLINVLPMGAYVTDEEGIVRNMNEQCALLLELSRSPQEILWTKGTEVFAELRDRLVPTDQPDELHLRDGRVVSYHTIPIEADGEILGALHLYRDMTQQRRADASKSEFMSLVSHQLRTPLNIMRWTFGRLEKETKDKISKFEAKLLSDAQAAMSRMCDTINTMLAISRIEAGEVRTEHTEVKLGQLLQEVRQSLRETYEHKHQTLSIDCPPNLFLHTDAYILREIVQNLLTNAVKYTPDTGEISVLTATIGGNIRIDVVDNGYGIPLHQQHKVFQKFFRAENVSERDTEGTGLGLYLVHLLCKLIRGHISFLSQEGVGTRFTVLFPRDLAASQPHASLADAFVRSLEQSPASVSAPSPIPQPLLRVS